MQTLTTAQEAIDLAFADSRYLPGESISRADIAAAETRYLIPVVGAALWAELLAGEHPALREQFVLPAAAYAVRLVVQPSLDVLSGAGGTVTPRGTQFQTATDSQRAAVRRAIRGRFSILVRALSDHLETHMDDYPAYDPEQNILNKITIAGGVVLDV